jgi:hypothetical protein
MMTLLQSDRRNQTTSAALEPLQIGGHSTPPFSVAPRPRVRECRLKWSDPERPRIASLAFSICILVGCAQAAWVKPGATQQDFIQDSQACRKEAFHAASGVLPELQVPDLESRCLEAHGWTQSD